MCLKVGASQRDRGGASYNGALEARTREEAVERRGCDQENTKMQVQKYQGDGVLLDWEQVGG